MMGAERGGGGSRAGSAGDSRRSKTQLFISFPKPRESHTPRAALEHAPAPGAHIYDTRRATHIRLSTGARRRIAAHCHCPHTVESADITSYMACTDTFTEDRPSSGPPHERTVSVPSYRISTAEPRSRVALRCRPCVDSHSTLIAYTYTHGAHKIGVHRIQGIHRTHPT